MNHTEKLTRLASRLTPPFSAQCSACLLCDDALCDLLDDCDGDLAQATYLGCLRLAESGTTTLPDLTVEAQRDYWLSLARRYRPNMGGCVGRLDEEAQ